METLREVALLLGATLAAILFIIPGFRSERPWARYAGFGIAAALTIAFIYSKATTGKDLADVAICGVLKTAPACVEAKSTASGPLTPCQVLASKGYVCSGRGLVDAVDAANKESIRLFVAGGIDGNTLVTSETDGAKAVWIRLAAANPGGLELLLQEMQRAGKGITDYPLAFRGNFPNLDEKVTCLVRKYSVSGDAKALASLSKHYEERKKWAKKEWDAGNTKDFKTFESFLDYEMGEDWSPSDYEDFEKRCDSANYGPSTADIAKAIAPRPPT